MNYSPDVCDQLVEILKYIPRSYSEKVPQEVVRYLYENCNSESTFIYNQALPLKEQKLLGGTIAALKEFSEKYWKNIPKEDGALVEYAKSQVVYTGIFIDPDEIYGNITPSLSHKIRDPHVTVAYRPRVGELLLDSLGSAAHIEAIAYGNDGKNEGLLVRVTCDDMAVQRTLGERESMGADGESRLVPMHVTLSIADGAKAVDTRNLQFRPLENTFELRGKYGYFCKDGTLVSDKEVIKRMQRDGFKAKELSDFDRPR